MLGGLLIAHENRLRHALDVGQTPLHGLPDRIGVNCEIAVNQDVTYADRPSPDLVWVLRPEGRR